ncbi:MAG: flagellar basal body rod protein FlgC, partial [Tumebacillaceae bacterium]
MGLFDGINISASGLTAQRMRLDVISSNIANANTTRGANGLPYVRQVVTLGERTPQASFQDTLSGELGQAPSAGVRVV